MTNPWITYLKNCAKKYKAGKAKQYNPEDLLMPHQKARVAQVKQARAARAARMARLRAKRSS